LAATLNPAEHSRMESMHSARREGDSPAPGLVLREFVSHHCGARGFSTGTATLDPGAVLPRHRHPFSEVVVVLSGTAEIEAEERCYRLQQFDCVHLPAGIAHQVTNPNDSPLLALWAFASAIPSRELVNSSFGREERGLNDPSPGDPESIVRFAKAATYELAPGTEFRDLFAGRFGVEGICGGYGRFQPGASLPCHIHQCDESITVMEGEAKCLVQGNGYRLSGCDTAFVPEGKPHRFLNQSNGPMAMIWVYASSEPERTLVEPAYCDGTVAWPGPELALKFAG
jgi:quercetin dioxygenase-like cupin family protein